MGNIKKSLVSCLLAIALMGSPLSVLAEHYQIDQDIKPSVEPTTVVADLVFVRPLGIVATIAGAAFFVVGLPFSALGGNTEETWETLVVSPASYTFKRPLGEFED